MTNDELKKVILEHIASPKRAKNDAGEVEARDLSDVISALKYAAAVDASSDPFGALRQARIEKRDGWRD